METKLKWNRTIDYYAIKSIQLERALNAAKQDVERLERTLETYMQRPKKKYSKFFVVFQVNADGSYHSPAIVEADSPEEALCPEGTEAPRAEICQRLLDISEFAEL